MILRCYPNVAICYTSETYQILSPVLFQQSLYFPLLIHRIFYLLVKLEVQWKESKLPVLIDHLRSICDRQVAEIEKAVIGRGEWRFDPSYCCLEVPEHIWFKKSEEQRRRHLTKVMAYECRSEPSPTSLTEADEMAAAPTGVLPPCWKLALS